MQTNNIISIEINNLGQLIVKPNKINLSMIYRTASGINWDNNSKCLFTQVPKDWSYYQWFKYLIKIVKEEANVELIIDKETKWLNINDIEKNKFLLD